MKEEIQVELYKKPYMILLSACDRAVDMLPEEHFVRVLLIAAMNEAEDAWIEGDEKT